MSQRGMLRARGDLEGLMAILTTLYSFDGNNSFAPTGSGPRGTLIMDAAGDLFGTADGAGTNGYGTVFELANNGSGYATAPTALFSFNYNQGAGPAGTVIMDAAGNLFGTTTGAGANGGGTAWEIAKTSTGYANTPTVLVNLAYSSGAVPHSGLVMDSAGNLFGTTSSGINNNGTVFEIAKTATGYATTATVLATFTSTSGGAPWGGVLVDAAGNLFGTTSGDGGTHNYGTVFEIAKTASGYASTPTTLATFNQTNGSYPSANLIMDAAGNLFGTTAGGGSITPFGGTVFEIVKTAAGYASAPTTLVSFGGTSGNDPEAGLLMDNAGNLYGTTAAGGTNSGTVFEVAKTATGYASTPTTLVDFIGSNGSSPFGSLIMDSSGTIYGTTAGGGATNGGTIFQLVASNPLSVSVSGTAQEGQTLTANPSRTVVSYQWQEVIGGTWGNISGATGATYLVQPADDGRQIRVQATDSSGITATSAASNAVLDAAGNQPVYEKADQTTIGNGHFQYVFGIATNTTVNGGGEQGIYKGGIATGTTLNAGGIEVDWGTANTTSINGGSQYVWGTASTTAIATGAQVIESGGTANNTTIGSGGEQDIYGGGTASGTTIAGGKQSVYGTADNTTIGNAGTQYDFGTATNTTINSGGEQGIYSGSSATGTTLNAGGTQVDYGTATSTSINGGNQYVWGTATTTAIATGAQIIESGGAANNTTIGSGGEQDIYGSGTASGTTINSGGTEHVFAGGAAHNVTFGGPNATLALDQTSSALTGTISGWQAGDHIDLGDILFHNPGTTLGFTENAANTGGTLTVSDGSHVATLALLGQYMASSFALSSDGHGGTLVTDPAIAAQATIATPHHA
jgi:autotransporter passenger strand-loop-strand repeat protein